MLLTLHDFQRPDLRHVFDSKKIIRMEDYKEWYGTLFGNWKFGTDIYFERTAIRVQETIDEINVLLLGLSFKDEMEYREEKQ